MARRNRNYKKGEPHRDARLFVIICEAAKREKAYFDYLKQQIQSPRIAIKVIAPGDTEDDPINRSAPKFLLERAAKHEESKGYSDSDLLWFVLDVDDWKPATIHELRQYCEAQKNWYIAISNPCFEVWVHLHYQDIDKSQATTCQEFKRELDALIKGGYKVEVAMKNLKNAVVRAESIDIDPKSPIPASKTTRVYQLIKQMEQIIAINFLNKPFS